TRARLGEPDHRALEPGGPQLVPVLQHREHEVLLGGELTVDRLERGTGLVPHRVHAHATDAVTVEQPVGGLHDLRAHVLLGHLTTVPARDQARTKRSSASLTSSAWVQSRPCGAPSISTYSASGTS